MKTYICQRQNTSAQYIATQSILDLCEAVDIKQGALVGMLWWEQVEIELEGAR